MNMEQKKINIGLIGLGARGTLLLHDVLLEHEDAVICAVCDVYEDRCEKAAQYIQEKTGQKPFQTTNYKEIFERKEVDAVLLCSSWESHIHLAIEAMECGKAVGCEVGGAYSIRECWRLVETYEQTKTPIMLMENCCYGRDEMMAMHMVHQGVLGEIVHCAGGYMHDLRQEVAFGKEERHYSRAGTDCPDTWDQSGQSYGFFNLHGVKGSGTAPLYRKRKIRRSRADADRFSSRRHCDDTHPMCEWRDHHFETGYNSAKILFQRILYPGDERVIQRGEWICFPGGRARIL